MVMLEWRLIVVHQGQGASSSRLNAPGWSDATSEGKREDVVIERLLIQSSLSTSHALPTEVGSTDCRE